MKALRILLIFLFYIPLAAQTPGEKHQPKNSEEWFARGAARMGIRSLGSVPFHLHVTFHAYPGEQLLATHEKSDLIVGDGTYDEVWLEPHKWRREVTLSGYHAIEAESDGVRKMQASSDYEPSRVYMLLDALLAPIPRTLTSREFRDRSDWKGWRINPVTSGSLSLVRLSRETGTQRGDFAVSYYFFPATGALAMENRFGLVNIWSDDALFDDKIVPRGLTVRRAERDLLTATITIEHAEIAEAETFNLPGPPAEPGMTLRPLHDFEIRVPDNEKGFSFAGSESGRGPFFALVGQIDRHGRYRELEFLLAPSQTWAGIIVHHFATEQLKAPTIDGTPCQFQKIWRVM